MNDPRWLRVEEVFHKARALPPEQRRPFLERECAGEARVLQAALRLIEAAPKADERFDAVIDPPAFLLDPSSPSPPVSSLTGARLGPWQLDRPLATGGMGSVWIAHRADGQFEMAVAVKLLRRGFDTDDARRRFAAERQILAHLDHPSIARLIDGGISEDGLPYLVMELVVGRPLDQFCAEKRLGVVPRLALFCKVCDAVRFAHARLIVHRDLKPSNILVTDEGEVKLLDFGIAKLLDDPGAAEQTSGTNVMMTPRYASPEQVLGLPVTTQSDVYSLGVILFELLTGRSPYTTTQRTVGQWFEAIQREVCPPPSTAVGDPALRKLLAGDLDTIVRKAVEKESQDRYASVEQLDGDVSRHVAGLPILARPQTAMYRATKFVQRHVLAVAATAAAVGLLLAAFGVTLWQYRVASRERTLAERRFEQVRQLARLTLFDLFDIIQQTPGTTTAQRLLVSKTLGQYKRMASEAKGDPTLLAELAEGYRRMGDLQGNPYVPNLGDLKEAVDTYRLGLDLLKQIPEGTGAATLERARATLLRSVGEVVATTGATADGVASMRKGTALLESLRKRFPRDATVASELYSSYSSLADHLAGIGTGVPIDSDAAVKLFQQERDGWRDLGTWPDLPLELRQRAQRGQAIALMKLGNFANSKEKYDEALRYYQQARQAMDRLDRVTANTLLSQRLRGNIYKGEALALLWSGRTREAVELLAQGVEWSRQILAQDPGNEQTQSGLVILLNIHGDAANQAGDKGTALKSFQEAEALAEKVSQHDPNNAVARSRLEELQQKIAALGGGR